MKTKTKIFLTIKPLRVLFYPHVFFIVIAWEKVSENIQNLKTGGECNKEPIDIFKMEGNVSLKEPIGGNVMWNFRM